MGTTMPCYTPDDPPPTQAQLNARGEMTLAQHEAVLCGILTKLATQVLPLLDYAEIGVPHDLIRRWWIKHQAEDNVRRAREAQTQAQERLREQALSKLTPQERKALKL